MGRLPLFLVFWLISIYSFSQQVYFTPPMVDTAALERISYIDSNFHPFFEMTNKGETPLHFRFLLNWPGHEHIMDNDSALLEFIGKDPVFNLAKILKTPYSGDNPYPVHITGGMGLPKKYRLIEFLEGFEGRLCGDYANLANYILSRLGYKVQIVGTRNHIFNIVHGRNLSYGATLDFDPNMPTLRYTQDIFAIIRDKNLMLAQSQFADRSTPYSGVSIPGALTPQLFWRSNLSSFSDSSLENYPAFIGMNSIPANTSNELILPGGASLKYEVSTRGVVLNADLAAGRALSNQTRDSLNSHAWNSDAGPEDYMLISEEGLQKFCKNNAGDSGILSNGINFGYRWQDNFGSNAHLAIQNLNYQLLVLVIPPHKDTLWAGRDYRVPFWIEKSVIDGKTVPGLSVVDSLNQNPQLHHSHSWRVADSHVQTLTMGHLYPSYTILPIFTCILTVI